jgi:hypothetical protein
MIRQTRLATLGAIVRPSWHLSAGWLTSLRQHIEAWAEGLASGYAAAALYEQLSRLSDAELARRGIPRAELHRRVLEELGRPAREADSSANPRRR